MGDDEPKVACAIPATMAGSLLNWSEAGDLGAKIAGLQGVHAVTDITGFGLGGHLTEVLEASGSAATISKSKIPIFHFVPKYLEAGTSPGGTQRNWDSYGQHINIASEDKDHRLIADPQTSGGLLITVDPAQQQEFEGFTKELGYNLQPLGTVEPFKSHRIKVID